MSNIDHFALLNIYNNAEAGKILGLSRERMRQLREQVQAKPIEVLQAEREFEDLRNQYLEDMSSGEASRHSKRIREFAEENCLPWPPSSIHLPASRKMDDVLKSRLVRDYKQGASIETLANKYNIHSVYVYKIIRMSKECHLK